MSSAAKLEAETPLPPCPAGATSAEVAEHRWGGPTAPLRLPFDLIVACGESRGGRRPAAGQGVYAGQGVCGCVVVGGIVPGWAALMTVSLGDWHGKAR